jgi:hypothetical protein
MRTTLLRILKHGVPVAVGLYVVGYLFAQTASMWVGGPPPRVGPVMQTGGEPTAAPVVEGMTWRVPLAMAGWGLLLVAGYELLAGMWRRPSESITDQTSVTTTEPSEAAVQEFLREAEAKATNLANTPAPIGTLHPQTVDA